MDGLLLGGEQPAGAGLVSSGGAAPTVRTVVVDVTALMDVPALVGDTLAGGATVGRELWPVVHQTPRRANPTARQAPRMISRLRTGVNRLQRPRPG